MIFVIDICPLTSTPYDTKSIPRYDFFYVPTWEKIKRYIENIKSEKRKKKKKKRMTDKKEKKIEA